MGQRLLAVDVLAGPHESLGSHHQNFATLQTAQQRLHEVRRWTYFVPIQPDDSPGEWSGRGYARGIQGIWYLKYYPFLWGWIWTTELVAGVLLFLLDGSSYCSACSRVRKKRKHRTHRHRLRPDDGSKKGIIIVFLGRAADRSRHQFDFMAQDVALAISNVQVSTTATTATITWNTNLPADSEVGYLWFLSKTNMVQSEPATDHSVTLTALFPDTNYSYTIKSVSQDGQSAFRDYANFTTKLRPAFPQVCRVIRSSRNFYISGSAVHKFRICSRFLLNEDISRQSTQRVFSATLPFTPSKNFSVIKALFARMVRGGGP